MLADLGPDKGRALELASGTGQHVAHFARTMPALTWQPSDIDPARRQSIDAYGQGIANLRRACEIDATGPGWGQSTGGRT